MCIRDRSVSVKEGTTILKAAKTIGETIPTLCYLKEVNAIGACRVCVVEVEGTDRCVTCLLYTSFMDDRHDRQNQSFTF